MKNGRLRSLTAVGSVAVFLATAFLFGGFGLVDNKIASQPVDVKQDKSADSLSPDDWVGIRNAYYANRPGEIDVLGQQAYLKPAAAGTTQNFDQAGYSIAVSSDTVVVGSPFEDSNTTGISSTPNDTGGTNFDSGAVYVFVRNAGVWSQQAYLKPAVIGTSQAQDQFGISVAIAGDTIVVGADGENSSTTGVNSTPNESNGNAGAAYVFTRTGAVWTQQAYLKPAAFGTSQTGDSFGFSVSISGDTIGVGARSEDSSSTGINSTPNESATFSGAAYVFTRTSGAWTQQAYIKPAAVGTTQASDFFGSSISVSGDTMVVGAPQEDSAATGVNGTPSETSFTSGAAYVFVRNGGTWSQQAFLKPAAVGTTQAGDEFGSSVAVAGDIVVVGAARGVRLQTSNTSSFGVYALVNVPTGSTFIVTATNKRYRFSPVITQFTQNASNLDFVGLI